MSKIGLNALAPIHQKQIDADKTRNGIVVSAVSPGYCKTDMTKNIGGGILSAAEGICFYQRKISL